MQIQNTQHEFPEYYTSDCRHIQKYCAINSAVTSTGYRVLLLVRRMTYSNRPSLVSTYLLHLLYYCVSNVRRPCKDSDKQQYRFITLRSHAHTFVRVGSTAMLSTLPACPRQQCRAFSLFRSEFHSHSSTVWSSEAVNSSELRPSEQKTRTRTIRTTKTFSKQ